jgi:hypothetical protein
VARTAVATETLQDLNKQIEQSFNKASQGVVPELKFLGPSQFNALKKETRNLQLKQEQER